MALTAAIIREIKWKIPQPPIKTTAKHNTTTDSTHEHPKHKKNARLAQSPRHDTWKSDELQMKTKNPHTHTHSRHLLYSIFRFYLQRLLRFDYKRNCFLSVSLLRYKFRTCVNEKVCLCACMHASVVLKYTVRERMNERKMKRMEEKKHTAE